MRRLQPRPGNQSIAIGYIRMSTDDQALSPDVQEKALIRWAAERRIQLLEVHHDLGVCGALPVQDRPGILAALEAVKRTGAGHLLVAKRDRLARDYVEAGMFERLIEREGARIVSAAGEGSEMTDPAGVIMRGIIDLFATYERLVIKARTKAALGVMKSRGLRVGHIPYGWKLAGDGRTLVHDRREQAIIATARRYRERNPEASLRDVGRHLTKHGFYPRRGEVAWQATQIKRILEIPEDVGYNPALDR